jgi:hypothetical protein
MLQYSDISIDRENGLINLSLPSSKTDQLAIRTNLGIPRFENVKICPVHTLLNYLKLRPKLEGPLFCHFIYPTHSRHSNPCKFKTILIKAKMCASRPHLSVFFCPWYNGFDELDKYCLDLSDVLEYQGHFFYTLVAVI